MLIQEFGAGGKQVMLKTEGDELLSSLSPTAKNMRFAANAGPQEASDGDLGPNTAAWAYSTDA